MFYEEIFKILDENKVKYVVAGGVAVVLHGVVRLTVDIDLYVKLTEDNLIKFVNALEFLGYVPKVPVKGMDFVSPVNREKWKEEKGMKIFSFIHPKKHRELIDVFIEEIIDYDRVDNDKVVVKADNLKIPVMSIDHLKLLKEKAGREQDLSDIKALDAIQRLRETKK